MNMGYYIETPSNLHKSDHLVKEHQAIIISKGEAKQAVMDGKGVICVVNNGAFEAAAFIYSMREYDDFAWPADPRPKTWLVMDISKAKQLSGYNR